MQFEAWVSFACISWVDNSRDSSSYFFLFLISFCGVSRVIAALEQLGLKS